MHDSSQRTSQRLCRVSRTSSRSHGVRSAFLSLADARPLSRSSPRDLLPRGKLTFFFVFFCYRALLASLSATSGNNASPSNTDYSEHTDCPKMAASFEAPMLTAADLSPHTGVSLESIDRLAEELDELSVDNVRDPLRCWRLSHSALEPDKFMTRPDPLRRTRERTPPRTINTRLCSYVRIQ